MMGVVLDPISLDLCLLGKMQAVADILLKWPYCPSNPFAFTETKNRFDLGRFCMKMVSEGNK